MSGGGAWGFVLRNFFAHGFVRVPVALTPALLWGTYGIPMWEDAFNSWNEGHNQKDIWNRLAQKVKDTEETA